jgi:hypothetical protein
MGVSGAHRFAMASDDLLAYRQPFGTVVRLFVFAAGQLFA